MSEGFNEPKEPLAISEDIPTFPAEARSEDDELELKLSYNDFARLYDSGKITYSQLRRGKVRRDDLPQIQAFLENSTDLPQNAGQGELAIDIPVDTVVDHKPKQANKQFFGRDFIIEKPASSRSKSFNETSTPVLRADVVQQPEEQPASQVIFCNIQDTIRFQVIRKNINMNS